jgi:putative endonuclease
MKQNTSLKQKRLIVGKMGELLVAKALENKGFYIECMNYRKKWGEIDVVASREGKLHFVEVKTVTRKTSSTKLSKNENQHQPEENIHESKIKRLLRTIQTYIAEKDFSGEYFLDYAMVYLDRCGKVIKTEYMHNQIFEA